jgi:hypothetical protein
MVDRIVYGWIGAWQTSASTTTTGVKRGVIMIRITVFTVPGHPVFEVPLDTTTDKVREMVLRRWGWIGIYQTHSWGGEVV